MNRKMESCGGCFPVFEGELEDSEDLEDEEQGKKLTMLKEEERVLCRG